MGPGEVVENRGFRGESFRSTPSAPRESRRLWADPYGVESRSATVPGAAPPAIDAQTCGLKCNEWHEMSRLALQFTVLPFGVQGKEIRPQFTALPEGVRETGSSNSDHGGIMIPISRFGPLIIRHFGTSHAHSRCCCR